MPIPVLLIGIAAATGAVGIGAGTKAGFDHSKAKCINENAAERYVYVAIDMNNDGEVDGKDYTALKNVINQNGVYNQATGKFT